MDEVERRRRFLPALRTLLAEMDQWHSQRQADLAATYQDVNERIDLLRKRLIAQNGGIPLGGGQQTVLTGHKTPAGNGKLYSGRPSHTASLNPSAGVSPMHTLGHSGPYTPNPNAASTLSSVLENRYGVVSTKHVQCHSDPNFHSHHQQSRVKSFENEQIMAFSNAAMRGLVPSTPPSKNPCVFDGPSFGEKSRAGGGDRGAASVGNLAADDTKLITSFSTESFSATYSSFAGAGGAYSALGGTTATTAAAPVAEDAAETDWSVIGTPMDKSGFSPSASPQVGEKMSVEAIVSRLLHSDSQSEVSQCVNFSSLYEQLMEKDDGAIGGSRGVKDLTFALTHPLEDGDYPNGASNSTFTVTSSGPRGAKGSGSSMAAVKISNGVSDRNGRGWGSVPLDSLSNLRDQFLTTSVRAGESNGRPTVEVVPGGAPDDPEKFGIGRNSTCEVYVEFKRGRVVQYKSDVYVAPGSYVIVGGDRGEDMGLVIYVWCETKSLKGGSDGSNGFPRSSSGGHWDGAAASGSGKPNVVGVGLAGSSLSGSIGVDNGTVLRIATESDVVQLLRIQSELERRAIDVCAQQVLQHGLPMAIVDAEYQFDKKKLTFFYEAQQRLDFRELVRDLYKTFRARIWMEMIES